MALYQPTSPIIDEQTAIHPSSIYTTVGEIVIFLLQCVFLASCHGSSPTALSSIPQPPGQIPDTWLSPMVRVNINLTFIIQSIVLILNLVINYLAGFAGRLYPDTW